MNELELLYQEAMDAGEVDLADRILDRMQAQRVSEYGPPPEAMEGVNLSPFGIDTGLEMNPYAAQALAGAGKRLSDIGTLGFRDNSLDAPLMDQPAAMAGAVGADIAALGGTGAAARGLGGALSTVAPRIGGGLQAAGQAMTSPQGILPAAGVGAGWEAATQPGGLKDRLMSGVVGAVAGGTVPAFAGMYNAMKSMIQPMTQSGRDKIAGETLRQFGGENLPPANQIIPGSNPTAAEVAAQVDVEGIPRLQEGLRIQSPEFGNELVAREAEQRLARRTALENIAKDEAEVGAAKEARKQVVEQLYTEADKYLLPVDEALEELLNRGAVKRAFAMAQENASNMGQPLNVGVDAEGNMIGEVSGRVLHDMKKALDGMSDKNFAYANGITKSQLGAITKAKDDFHDYLKVTIPEYKVADKLFAEMSQPINQMEAGQQLVDKYAPALSDYGATTRETAATYARQLNKMKKETKTPSGGKGQLESMVTPEAMDTMNRVGQDMGRKAKADDLMRGVGRGSNTAGNLSIDRILGTTIGGAGLPKGVADWDFVQTIVKPLKLFYGMSDDKIRDVLGEAMLDPDKMAELVKLTKPLSELPMNKPLTGGLQYGSPVGIGISGGLLSE